MTTAVPPRRTASLPPPWFSTPLGSAPRCRWTITGGWALPPTPTRPRRNSTTHAGRCGTLATGLGTFLTRITQRLHRDRATPDQAPPAAPAHRAAPALRAKKHQIFPGGTTA